MTDLLEGIELGELRGRRQKKLSAVAVRPLQEADLAVLNSGERRQTQTGSLAKLKDRHHTIARLVVAGKSNTEISLVTGMDPARISTLKSDPAFKDLLADYRRIEEGIAAEINDRLVMLSLTSVEELQSRLEDSEEPLPVQTVLEIAKFGTDRTGYGPMTKVNNLNVNVDLSSRLSSARKRLTGPIPVSVSEPVEADFVEVKPE